MICSQCCLIQMMNFEGSSEILNSGRTPHLTYPVGSVSTPFIAEMAAVAGETR